MFKYNGRYYFNSSDLHGWNASHTYTISATNILGPYSAETVMANTDADFSHVTQTGFFITVHGTQQTTVIFAGDRWSDFAGNGIGFNQWMPLTFVGTAPQFQSLSQWSLDATDRRLERGARKQLRAQPVVRGGPGGDDPARGLDHQHHHRRGATPYTNVGGGHTGRWKWRLTDTTAYQATIAQTVTGLPNGTYTLSAWVQSSGGQSIARLFARNGGGSEQDAAVNTAIPSWKQVTISGIAVTNGTCQIGLDTTASANQWVDLDDVLLVKTPD